MTTISSKWRDFRFGILSIDAKYIVNEGKLWWACNKFTCVQLQSCCIDYNVKLERVNYRAASRALKVFYMFWMTLYRNRTPQCKFNFLWIQLYVVLSKNNPIPSLSHHPTLAVCRLTEPRWCIPTLGSATFDHRQEHCPTNGRAQLTCRLAFPIQQFSYLLTVNWSC